MTDDQIKAWCSDHQCSPQRLLSRERVMGPQTCPLPALFMGVGGVDRRAGAAEREHTFQGVCHAADDEPSS